MLPDDVLRRVLQLVPAAIVVIDSAGVIVLMSGQAAEMSGWSQSELLGRGIDQLLSPESMRQHSRYVTRQLQDGPEAKFRLITQRSDGSSFLAEVTLTVFDHKEGEQYMIANLADVGDLGMTFGADPEAAPRSRQDSDRLAGLAQLTAQISGDLTQLTSVTLDHALLLEGSITNPEGLSTLRHLQQAAAGAAVLGQQINDLARRDSVMEEPIDVNEVVWSSAEALALAAGDDIVVHLKLALSPLWVMADRRELEYVLLCMTLNARDATPGDGALTIATGSEPHADGTDRPPAVKLSMTDEGVGMSPESVEQAFDPLFTTKADRAGIGLGLASVRSFAERALGTAAIHSVVGAGTTVSLVLPALDAVAHFDRRDRATALGTTGIVDEPTAGH